MNSAVHDSRRLQFAELLGERALRDPGNCPLEFRKPFGVPEKLLENGGFPAPADDAGGGLDGTERKRLLHEYQVTEYIPRLRSPATLPA